MDSLCNLEAEMSVLGAIFFAPEALDKVPRLQPEDFSDGRHRLLFETIRSLSGKNQPIDQTTITTELKNRVVEAGGLAYVAELINYAPTAVNAGTYGALVQDAATRRRLVESSRETARAAHEAESAAEALDIAETSLLALRNASHGIREASTLSSLLHASFKRLEKNEDRSGVPTGIPDLDRMTAGLHGGDLIIVAGRPSMGKTALGMNLAESAAAAGCPTLVFSLEMSKEQLVNRILSGSAKVDAQKLRTGELNEEDWHRMNQAAENLHALPLLVEDSASVTVWDIRAMARRNARSKGLGLIIIDYLQLIRPVKTHSTREREVSEISRSLKALAKELNIPVVVLAQLNRDLEKGATPRKPIPSDLRESGSLEQDADLILFPWREAAYCPECRKGKDCGTGHLYTAEVLVGKQRNGPIGSVKVTWIPEFTRFEPPVFPST